MAMTDTKDDSELHTPTALSLISWFLWDMQNACPEYSSGEKIVLVDTTTPGQEQLCAQVTSQPR